MANDWLRSGATVLDLSQRARQSTKGSARRSLVEQTLTTDIVVRTTIYEVRTLTIDCGSLTHMFVLCRLMPHESTQRWYQFVCVCRVVSCCRRVSREVDYLPPRALFEAWVRPTRASHHPRGGVESTIGRCPYSM